jgi:hypothetical protein
VSAVAAALFLRFPLCCRREPWAADEPSVVTCRISLPSGRRAVLSCRGLTRRFAPRSRRRLTAAASCREPGMPVPRAQHGHAAALGCQDPRACVRALAAKPDRARLLARHAQPRHGLAVRVHPRDAAATSRSRRGHVIEAFSQAPSGCSHSRTRAHTHTRLPHRTRTPPHRIPP